MALFGACVSMPTVGGAVATGQLDRGFNHSGFVSVSDQQMAVALVGEPNGGLVVAYAPGGAAEIARYTPAGVADPGFGASGVASVTLGVGGIDIADQVVADGTRLLVFLSNPQIGTAFGVARLTSTGILDTAFHHNGIVSFVAPTGNEASTLAAEVLSDGRIEFAVEVDQQSADWATDLWLYRLNSDGTPDTSLGPNGTKHLAHYFGVSPDYTHVSFTSSGGFDLFQPLSDNAHAVLQRFDVNGTLDKTLGRAGQVWLACPGSLVPTEGPYLTVDTKGRLLVVCPILDVASDLYVTRYLAANAKLDPTFAAHGTLHIRAGSDSGNNAGFGIDESNRIIAFDPVGVTSGDHTVIQFQRYTSTGVPDTSFGIHGHSTLTLPGEFWLNNAPNANFLVALATSPHRIFVSFTSNSVELETAIRG